MSEAALHSTQPDLPAHGLLIFMTSTRGIAMSNYGERVVVNLGFEATLGETCRAIREEGLQVIARIDLRDHFWRVLGHNFRRYFLLETWSPELALEALGTSLEMGTIFPTTFAVCEHSDHETIVVAKESLAPAAAELEWRRDAPALAAIADHESERVARVLERLRRASSQDASALPAA
jgi:uncharacterized protein (DUF302 family)